MVLRLTRNAGILIGWVLFHVLPKRRNIVQTNIKLAYPEKTNQQIEELSRKNFQHYGTILAEILFFRKKKYFQNLIKIERPHIIQNALLKKRGVILMSAHLGNWEVGLHAFKLHFPPFYVVAREIKSVWASYVMKKFRTRYGVEVVPAKNSYRMMLQLLRENKIIGFAYDQHHGKRGIYVDFFGQPAATSPGIAMLARETGAVVIPTFNYRNPDGSFTLTCDLPMYYIQTDNPEFDLFNNTQIFTKKIEEWVRKFPQQWFWLHRRWKGRQNYYDESRG
ncbi:MAG: lysophospholipid acyltransferase family protein [Deltaproteobacteria bacterium]|nr:lysophospholipid acyltransferase family protein [Deltaproteobacteria bacterium]